MTGGACRLAPSSLGAVFPQGRLREGARLCHVGTRETAHVTQEGTVAGEASGKACRGGGGVRLQGRQRGGSGEARSEGRGMAAANASRARHAAARHARLAAWVRLWQTLQVQHSGPERPDHCQAVHRCPGFQPESDSVGKPRPRVAEPPTSNLEIRAFARVSGEGDTPERGGRMGG